MRPASSERANEAAVGGAGFFEHEHTRLVASTVETARTPSSFSGWRSGAGDTRRARSVATPGSVTRAVNVTVISPARHDLDGAQLGLVDDGTSLALETHAERRGAIGQQVYLDGEGGAGPNVVGSRERRDGDVARLRRRQCEGPDRHSARHQPLGGGSHITARSPRRPGDEEQARERHASSRRPCAEARRAMASRSGRGIRPARCEPGDGRNGGHLLRPAPAEAHGTRTRRRSPEEPLGGPQGHHRFTLAGERRVGDAVRYVDEGDGRHAARGSAPGRSREGGGAPHENEGARHRLQRALQAREIAERALHKRPKIAGGREGQQGSQAGRSKTLAMSTSWSSNRPPPVRRDPLEATTGPRRRAGRSS